MYLRTYANDFADLYYFVYQPAADKKDLGSFDTGSYDQMTDSCL